MPVISVFLRNGAGTFKTRFLEYATDNGIPVLHDSLSTDTEQINVVLKNRNIPGVRDSSALSRRVFTCLVNPSAFYHIDKKSVQSVLIEAEIPVPEILTRRSMYEGPAVWKPVRGECGIGVRFERNYIPQGRFGHFAQRFIGPPEDMGTAFDVRIYTFCGKYLASTMRLANPDNIQVSDDGRIFGLTNTHSGGTMCYFEIGINHRCPEELVDYFETIRRWLGFKEPPETLKKMAERVAAALNLGYCAIDVLFDENRQPYVIDVNPNAMMGYRTKADRIRMERTIAIMRQIERMRQNERS